MRCFWCDNDGWQFVGDDGVIYESPEKLPEDKKIVDYVCTHCAHQVSEGNPRAGDPEETVESLKEERDELRSKLTACESKVPDREQA